MFLRPHISPLIILGITSLVCSRVLFLSFNDPEGPNLLIVTVAAAVIHGVSLAVYAYGPFTTQNDFKKLLIIICIQTLVVAGFYF